MSISKQKLDWQFGLIAIIVVAILAIGVGAGYLMGMSHVMNLVEKHNIKF